MFSDKHRKKFIIVMVSFNETWNKLQKHFGINNWGIGVM